MGRLLAAGASIWLAYACVWIAVAGPVLDESVLAGQVIAGDVVYPDGHPNAVIYRRAPLLLYRLAGLEWAVMADAQAISAVRNVLFLFLSAFVPFAATLACTRRPAWGHVAAALTLSETACSLVGVYLQWVFPGFFSTGHVGIHVTVLAVVLVVAGVPRLGGFLAGLLPVVHASMTLVAWPALALWLVRHRPATWRRVLGAGAYGLTVAAALLAAIVWRAPGAAPALYAPGPDAATVLRGYAETTDPHRQPFPMHSPLGLVGPIAFATLALLALAGRPAERATVGALAATGAIAWILVLGTRAWQALAGGLPASVLAVMPGRFANVAMLLLVPLAVTTIATAPRAAWLATALLAVETVLALMARPLAFAALVDVIVGVAIGAAIADPVLRRRALGGALAIAVSFLAVGRGGAFLAATIAAAGLGIAVRVDARASGAAQAALAAACVAAALAASRGPHVPNAWDAGSERPSADERALAGWLREHVPRDALLVAPLYPPTWIQAKTGHPVLVDTMTLANVPYFPATASAVGRLVRDVFGIDYADPDAVRALRGPDGMLRPTSPAWTAAWAARPCDGWRRLADRYGFRHVWAPRTHPVRLPVAWSGTDWALHHVPDSCAAQATAP